MKRHRGINKKNLKVLHPPFLALCILFDHAAVLLWRCCDMTSSLFVYLTMVMMLSFTEWLCGLGECVVLIMVWLVG